MKASRCTSFSLSAMAPSHCPNHVSACHFKLLLTSMLPAGFLLYLLDLTFRLAQWINMSIVTGTVLSEGVLALHLKFTPVRAESCTASH